MQLGLLLYSYMVYKFEDLSQKEVEAMLGITTGNEILSRNQAGGIRSRAWTRTRTGSYQSCGANFD